MGAVSVEEMTNGSGGNGEKIYVSVRIRPLNGKEIARNDVSEWECINEDTIIFRSNVPVPERSMYPTAYTFDRVFSRDCSTRQVYEDGVKDVAFSVVTGINSSIFAYGQTSSGKTYTMSGITEYTMADIYEYIEMHKEREFFLRFSAMEIYNESVRDLLSSDTAPLRLLDDPERGTIVEKLTEETLRDWDHLKQLLSVCEAQRQVGETSLNETSSRSHQILRLTIESSGRELLRNDHPNTLTATVNFIDLAGSERASQSLSAGSRLKEGCHINRSLLTLGTVIRKLSKGKSGHVPFRDSKLTRILQSSLDGNARTAIICTMSPARTHVEQSRNTLLFASCAKEVTTNAQVNLVVSDKALVKHLQRELARLENELRTSGINSVTSDPAALLREKDLQIEELKNEIEKLNLQRELAQSQIESDNNYPKLRVRSSWDERISTFDICALSDVGSSATSQNFDSPCRSNSEEPYLQFPDSEENSLNNSTSPSISISSGFDQINRSTDENFDDLCKDVRCIDIEESIANKHAESNNTLISEEILEIPELKVVSNVDRVDQELLSCPSKERELTCNHSIYDFPSPYERSFWMSNGTSSSRYLTLSKSRSCKASLVSSLSSHWFEKTEMIEHTPIEHTPPNVFEKEFLGRPQGVEIKLPALNFGSDNDRLLRKKSMNSVGSDEVYEFKGKVVELSNTGNSTSINTVKEMTELQFVEKLADTPVSAAVDDFKEKKGKNSNTGENTCITIIKEMTKVKSDEKLADTSAQEIDPEAKEFVKNLKDVGLDPLHDDDSESSPNWTLKFKKHQLEIIELWDICNVPLVHRTYFFLLFKGDPSDDIYIEVELRRLSFLKNTFSSGNEIVEAGRFLRPTSSMKALYREREMLSKRMVKKFSKQDMENHYLKWGIDMRSKNRRLQLAHRLWTDTKDMNHITESANIVAKLVSFIKPEQVNKEMFGLNFNPRSTQRRSFSWKHSLKL